MAGGGERSAGGNVFELEVSGSNLILDESGVLSAGTYTLTMNLLAERFASGSALASIESTLLLSRPSVPTETVTWSNMKDQFAN